MTLQEKFDSIIDCIERLVYAGENNIPQALARESGVNLRLLGDAFQFIADMTLIKYIRQRRLVRALSNRIEFNLPVEEVVSDAGFSDAASFSKACKNEFDLSPIQITEDVLKKYTPLSFAIVASDRGVDHMENDALTTQNNTTNAVSAEQFAEIKQVLEISALYGFSDDESEFVYHMAKEFNLTIEDAAEFCEEAKLEDKYDLYSSEMQQALSEIRGNGYSHLHELPDGFWDVYLSEENNRHGWHIPYICEIAEALNEHGMCADDLEEIVMHADTYCVDIVEAIENFEEYEKDWDDMINDALENGIPEDDTAGFGYRSIWEFDEE